MLGVYRYDDTLRAVTVRGVCHQLGVLYGRSVDAYLIGTRVQQPAYIFHLANTAAHRQRNEYLGCHFFDNTENQIAVIGTRGNIEKG
jgi:hypothetical protein